MESTHLSKKSQSRELKDVADTALIVCGFFTDSLNSKIINLEYYHQIGQLAYNKLNSLIPSFYDFNLFYEHLSNSFNQVSSLINIIAKESFERSEKNQLNYILNHKIS